MNAARGIIIATLIGIAMWFVLLAGLALGRALITEPVQKATTCVDVARQTANSDSIDYLYCEER